MDASDPLRDLLEELVHSIDPTVDLESMFGTEFAMFAYAPPELLTQLEESIEGQLIPPLEWPGPFVFPLPPLVPLGHGPTSPGPPPPPETDEEYWTGLEPPEAARPYYTGLPSVFFSPSTRQPAHVGTGIRHESQSPFRRLCAAIDEWVDEQEACQSCEYWEEDAGGSWCSYEAQEDTRDMDGYEPDEE